MGETYGGHGARDTTDFTERVADPSLTHSPSEGPSTGELKLKVKNHFSCK